MGGVRLFGRNWSVSTDDWVFSSIIELFLRIIWLAILLVVTFGHVISGQCNSLDTYRVFFIGLVSCLVLNLPLTFGLMLTSARGSILRDRHKRLPWVPAFLYAKLLVYIVEIGWVVFGFYWAFYDETNCPWSLVVVVRIMVIAALVVALFNAVNVWLIFDPLGSEAPGRGRGARAERIMKTHKVWERRCRIIFCGCAPKDREKDAFTSIAHLLANYFVDMDLTPSDIAAGLLLLRRRQENEQLMLEARQRAPVTRQSPDSPPVAKWLEFETISYFMKYALSCYGWPIFMMTNLCTGCCKLCGFYRCCCSGCCQNGGDGEPFVIDDNCCQCNFAVILKVTGLARADILHVTFHNDLFESPYYVAVDHKRRALIVAVRGSLSPSDGLTDLTAVTGSLDPEGQPTFVVHGGILQSARYIAQRLLEKRILDQAFERYPDYQLVLSGHSLGAGIVSVLAVLLQQRYPGLKAYAYSPPLGLMNKEMAVFCRDFVVSVSLGYDLVTHLSIRNMYTLKQRVLEELHKTDQPKFKIVAKGLFRFCCGNLLSTRARSPTGEDPLLDGSSRNYQTTHNNDAATINAEDGDVDVLPEDGTALAQPNMEFGGRVLHVVEVTDSAYELPEDEDVDGLDVHFVQPSDLTSCLGLGRRNYRAVWSSAEHFQEILIHPRMITDHLPDRVDGALQYLVTNNIQPLYAEVVPI